jgi:glutamate-1-semialdehyde 2,1-aminomutase
VRVRLLVKDCLFTSVQREARIREKTSTSLAFWKRSCASLAGGVSSGLRRSAKPYPLFFERGEGARLIDVDGNRYLDYTLGWGPNILGNAPSEIIEAIQSEASRGLTFGAQHHLEFEVAERLTRMIPCADKVCFANSGTEIVQLALRLARACTGRRKFIKFEGHYHGWDDSVLQSYHPQRDQLPRDPQEPVPEGEGQQPATNTVVAQWNDEESVLAAFADHPDQISAILCEPLMCNNGCIAPKPGFLEFLRTVTAERRALLIFDEVITGFRLGLGGAQEYFGVTPDLATYAKALGAGTSLSVLAGKQEFMGKIERGEVVHAGTLNGNPLVLAAARASLDYLSRNNGEAYVRIFRLGDRLREGIANILRSTGREVCTAGVGSVFHVAFMSTQPANYRDLLRADKQQYSEFVLALLDEGVLPLPDGRWYVSAAHTEADIDETLAAVRRAVS